MSNERSGLLSGLLPTCRERLREACVQAFVEQFGEVEDANGAAGGIHAAA